MNSNLKVNEKIFQVVEKKRNGLKSLPIIFIVMPPVLTKPTVCLDFLLNKAHLVRYVMVQNPEAGLLGYIT